jgi:acyl-CoA thioester hydrolase
MPKPACTHVTVTRLVVRPTDMDSDRNVNNAVYFEYFQQARLEHLTRLGVVSPADFRRGSVLALAENTCRYLIPCYYGDVLLIWTATHSVGRTSFQLTYRVWREGDEKLIAAGSSAQVWLDQDNKPTPLPASVREVLNASVCPDLPKMPSRD